MNDLEKEIERLGEIVDFWETKRRNAIKNIHKLYDEEVLAYRKRLKELCEEYVETKIK